MGGWREKWKGQPVRAGLLLTGHSSEQRIAHSKSWFPGLHLRRQARHSWDARPRQKQETSSGSQPSLRWHLSRRACAQWWRCSPSPHIKHWAAWMHRWEDTEGPERSCYLLMTSSVSMSTHPRAEKRGGRMLQGYWGVTSPFHGNLSCVLKDTQKLVRWCKILQHNQRGRDRGRGRRQARKHWPDHRTSYAKPGPQTLPSRKLGATKGLKPGVTYSLRTGLSGGLLSSLWA